MTVMGLTERHEAPLNRPLGLTGPPEQGGPMPVDDARSWAERERDVLEALERDFQGRRPRLPTPPVHDRQAALAWWSRLWVSSSLLISDGLVLAAAVQAGTAALYLVAVLMFPLVFIPYLRPGRGHRRALWAGSARDRRV
jgi:hypothetical protein